MEQERTNTRKLSSFREENGRRTPERYSHLSYLGGNTIQLPISKYLVQAPDAGLPPHVTGIQAITNYSSVRELENDLGLKPDAGGVMNYPGGAAVAILGHEFFLLDDSRWTHEELLKEAVELSSDRLSQRKRASFWRWQREFFNDQGITDQTAIRSR
jgi:hypothetical protein